MPRYHSNFSEINDDPRHGTLYASGSSSTDSQTRTVIIQWLPDDISLSQVISSIWARGGIIRAQLLNGGRIPSLGIAAYVEFVHGEAASAFVESTKTHPPSYRGVDKAIIHEATVELVATPSFSYTWADKTLLQRQHTRRMVMKSLPAGFVWLFLTIIGPKKVMMGEYDNELEQLTLEFSSLFEANLAYERILYIKGRNIWIFENVSLSFADEHCEKDIANRTDDPTPYISSTELSTKFNRSPYNTHTHIPPPPPRVTNKTFKQPELPKLSPLQKLARYYDCDEDEAIGIDSDFHPYNEPISYRILGSSITLTRRRSGWSIPVADEMKLLMLHTLHSPDWKDF